MSQDGRTDRNAIVPHRGKGFLFFIVLEDMTSTSLSGGRGRQNCERKSLWYETFYWLSAERFNPSAALERLSACIKTRQWRLRLIRTTKRREPVNRKRDEGILRHENGKSKNRGVFQNHTENYEVGSLKCELTRAEKK